MQNDDQAGPLESLTDYSPDGVDLTLIRWMLSLIPEQRLKFLDKRINEIRKIWELNGIQPSFYPSNPETSAQSKSFDR